MLSSKDFDYLQVVMIVFYIFFSIQTPFFVCMFVLFSNQVERAFSVCGTIEYMAPEIIEGGESGHDKVKV